MTTGDDHAEGDLPAPGEVLAGKYRVDRVVGAGGMGCVLAATHLVLEQAVAIKLMLPRFAKHAVHVERFEREARAVAKLTSDHVAKVMDVGALPCGRPYMVMELLEGEDLAERLRRGPLAIDEAVDVLLEACEALAEAHATGIVHRDLKPGNIFLARRSDGGRRVKVLDFGIAKMLEGSGRALTRTSTIMGSPLYMSPEQMMSARSADARSDLWSLACILFECITGRTPFAGATLTEVCSRILVDPPEKLRAAAPHAPPALEAAVERALVKDPAGRHQDLGELCAALAPFAGPDGRHSANVVRRLLGLPAIDPQPPASDSLSSSSPAASSPAASSPAVSSPAVSSPSVEVAVTAAPVAQSVPAPPRRLWPLAFAAPLVIAGSLAFGWLLAPGEPRTIEIRRPRRDNSAAASSARRRVVAAPARSSAWSSPSASATAAHGQSAAPPAPRRPRVRDGDHLFNTRNP